MENTTTKKSNLSRFNLKVTITVCLFLITKHITFAQYSGFTSFGANITMSGPVAIVITGVNADFNTANLNTTVTQINASPNSSISLEGNWQNLGSTSPFAGSDGGFVTFNHPTATQSIGGISPTAFNNLVVLGTGTKFLAVNNTTVGGTSAKAGSLILGNGVINLNTNMLVVSNSSSLAIQSSTTGYIISETDAAINSSILRWMVGKSIGKYVYPFGVEGVQIPLSYDITSPMIDNASYVEMSTRKTTPDNKPWSSYVTSASFSVHNMFTPNTPNADGGLAEVIDRVYEVAPSAKNSSKITFAYRAIENTMTGANVSQIGARIWRTDLSTGTLPGAWYGDPLTDMVYGPTTAVTAPIGIGFVTTPELKEQMNQTWILTAKSAQQNTTTIANFIAECNNGKVRISWNSLKEIGTASFVIEGSLDGINYKEITRITPIGSMTASTSYSTEVGGNIYYTHYRILNFNSQGGVNILAVAPLTGFPCKENNNNFTILSKGTNRLSLYISSDKDGVADISVYNALGQLVEKFEKRPYKKGVAGEQFEENLKVVDGVYFVTVYSDGLLKDKAKILVTQIQ